MFDPFLKSLYILLNLQQNYASIPLHSFLLATEYVNVVSEELKDQNTLSSQKEWFIFEN